ncbi:MAG: lysophospholipid acyltransferase family protein, partial [Nitrososphaerales archaeon]
MESYVYSLFVVPLVALLPAQFAYGAAILRSDMRYKLANNLSRKVENRIELLFGSQFRAEERRSLARDYFRNQSCEAIDAMRLLGRGEELLRLVEVRGKKNLDDALAKGKGVILCSVHLGSPRCCFSVLGALGFPITLVANWSFTRDQGGFPLRWMIDQLVWSKPLTSHLRGPNIRAERFGVAMQVVKLLQKNEVVGIMLDGLIGPKDSTKRVQVDFLDGKASLAPGAITIAQLTGAPVLTMVMHRFRDWRHQVLEIWPPAHIDADAQSSFRRCLSVIETMIRRYPAQWHMWRSSNSIQRIFVPSEIMQPIREPEMPQPQIYR